MPKEKYFDNDRLEEIMRAENTNIYGAIRNIEIYCSQYQKDRMALQYYARMLIKVGRFEDAEKALIKLEKLIKEAGEKSMDQKQRTNLAKDEYSLRGTKLKLLAWQGEYEAALAYYQKHKASIIQSNETTHLLMFCCRYQLGIIPQDIDPESISEGYVYKQFLNYQEDVFLEYIKNRCTSSSENEADSSEKNSSFAQDFPLGDIYKAAKDIIKDNKFKSTQEAKRINLNFPLVSYTFSYPMCGITDGKVVDYFTVVVFSGTENIVKMYPSEGSEERPHFDFSTMNLTSKDPQYTKKLEVNGAIARFNRRYGFK